MNTYQIFKLLALRQKLRKRYKWTRKELEQYQGKALRDLRKFAYSNSPFYKKFHDGFMDRPLEELPILSKTELMKHWDELVTNRSVKLADVQDFLKHLRRNELFRNKYYVSSTAGSTGLRGVLIYDLEEWMTVLAS
ncbi:MAG: hypothetical protein HYW01_05385 [Deltaproteobacteria bacterium]|nr:hypothetical protein [Deltaproteobacteria bacterium]